MTNRRETRRLGKASKEVTEHFLTEIRVALEGDQYKPLRNIDMTQEEVDIAIKLHQTLKDRVSPNNGLTIQELASTILDSDTSYTQESIFKVERVIQWTKKTILERMLASKEGQRFNFMVCKIGDKYFNGGTDIDYLKPSFEYHGLSPSEAKGSFSTKGGGLIPIFDKKNNVWKEVGEYDISPTDLDMEGNLRFENIRGNYNTEQGLDELGYLMRRIDEILSNLKDEETITDFELVDILFPEAKIKNLKDNEVFKYYHTKVRDALYVSSGDTIFIKHKIEDGYLALHSTRNE